MPRPRTVSDEQIFEAASRAVARVGPARLTLADVGKEVGLSPATLLQRFGSKRGLLLAFARSSAGYSQAQFAAIRDAARSPLLAIFETGRCYALMAPSADELLNHLAFLQIDLSDADFYEVALANARESGAEIRRLVADAVAAGEIERDDVAALARLLEVVYGGALLTWAMLREGTAADFMSAQIETALRQRLTTKGKRRLAAWKRGA
jgi:AcrR family transcriptional regulator